MGIFYFLNFDLPCFNKYSMDFNPIKCITKGVLFKYVAKILNCKNLVGWKSPYCIINIHTEQLTISSNTLGILLKQIIRIDVTIHLQIYIYININWHCNFGSYTKYSAHVCAFTCTSTWLHRTKWPLTAVYRHYAATTIATQGVGQAHVNYVMYLRVGVGDTRNFCFNTIPSTFVMVLMSIDIDTEYLCIP